MLFNKPFIRKFPVGAEVTGTDNLINFRVWAPQCNTIELILSSNNTPFISKRLKCEDNGYFSGNLQSTQKEVLYKFRLNESPELYPDVASRFQPFGPESYSAVIDPLDYVWHDNQWTGIPPDSRVIYEMHIGTFTHDGSWSSAKNELPELASIGITILEILPVAEFAGRYSWGYDGVFQFAPSHNYGTPNDFREFIDTAHQCGIGVIIDIVNNHLGRGAEFFKKFSTFYFSKTYKNEWGEAINFDGHNSLPVREYFISAAVCFVEEYHIDGLRIDATQQIFDSSPLNIITELSTSVRNASKGRNFFIVAENEPQNSALLRECGIDALWSDDFHRVTTVKLTGRAEAYYSDYKGSAQEFISAAKYSYLYQGQFYTWQNKLRGTPSLDLPQNRFIHYLQNHDQIANSCRGLRLHRLTGISEFKTATALLILGPQIPLLFQGQEFGASSPFFFFTDQIQYASRLANGRKQFLSQFKSIEQVNGPLVPDPANSDSFYKSKLDLNERKKNIDLYRFHIDLLKIRKDDPVFKLSCRNGVDGAVLNHDCFVLRYFGLKSADDRLLIINFGSDLILKPNPEPLLAAPYDCTWEMEWYSESPAYGGTGAPPLIVNGIWTIAGRCAFFVKTNANKC